MRRIYLDHAATTPVDPEVALAMARVYRDVPGNASSIHAEGRAARALVDQAREQVAAAIGATPSEVVFTSGGTEADNLALRGALMARRAERDGLVTVATEHHAVLDTARDLAERAHVRLTVLDVGRDGRVAPEAVAATIDDRTSLVSVMHANNEIGTIQPIAKIGELCRARGVTFHSDAVQSVGALALDMRTLPVDLLSLNAHKFYGPKGVGALFVRKGTRLATIQTGGGQERGRRTGTENVAGIVGLGVAMRLAVERRAAEAARLAALRDRLIEGVLACVPDAILTGHRTLRLPNNASFCFRGADGPSIVMALDMEGFAVSSGSACTSGDTQSSAVLLALGLDEATAKGSLRISLGRATTDADVSALLEVLPAIVARVRGAAAVGA